MTRLGLVLVLVACGGTPPTAQPPVANSAPAPRRVPDQEARLSPETEEIVKTVAEAIVAVELVGKRVEAFDLRLTAAVQTIEAAQTQADRDHGKAQIEALEAEHQTLLVAITETRARIMGAHRHRGGKKISPACIDNPLAKECM